MQNIIYLIVFYCYSYLQCQNETLANFNMVRNGYVAVEIIHRVIHRLIQAVADKSLRSFSAPVQRFTIVRFRVALRQPVTGFALERTY